MAAIALRAPLYPAGITRILSSTCPRRPPISSLSMADNGPQEFIHFRTIGTRGSRAKELVKIYQKSGVPAGFKSRQSDHTSNSLWIDETELRTQYIRACQQSSETRFRSVCFTSIRLLPREKSAAPVATSHPRDWPGAGARCCSRLKPAICSTGPQPRSRR